VTDYPGPAKSIVGVLGGMGPSATADFMAKVVARTPVDSESDHLPIVVWSNPEIPDRTQALLGLGPSPVPAMLDGVHRLVAVGADSIAIPCNTAHAFLDELRTKTQAEFFDMMFFDMIEATIATVRRDHPGARRVGILSTSGTRWAQLYARQCRRVGLLPVELSDDDQARLVDPAIKAVKVGADLTGATTRIGAAAVLLARRGAGVVVAGCTEIPLVIGEAAGVLPVVDATECLAAAVVEHRREELEHARRHRQQRA
jgi:aspartate racemase